MCEVGPLESGTNGKDEKNMGPYIHNVPYVLKCISNKK